MQFIQYTFDAIVSNVQYKATIVQSNTFENFRVFSLYLKDENNENEYIEYCITVDKKCKVKIYDGWQNDTIDF